MWQIEDELDDGIQIGILRDFAAHEPSPELIVLAVEQP
jgi:hypothetical protein